MEFIATYWQGNPAAIAAELLLIEADMKIIEAIARKEEEHDGEGIAEVGHVSGDRSFSRDPLKQASIKQQADFKAFQEWQAAQSNVGTEND